MQEAIVLREIISDAPIGHTYYLLDDNDEVIESLEIDEPGLPAQITRTEDLQEPRSPEHMNRLRKHMDGEAEKWALDETWRRAQSSGQQQARSARVKLEGVALTGESAQ